MVQISHVCTRQGLRDYQEDRYTVVYDGDTKPSFYGVYDGHCGDWAAQKSADCLHLKFEKDAPFSKCIGQILQKDKKVSMKAYPSSRVVHCQFTFEITYH
jgi:serine/threonine protein phosphatase PrpC